MECGHDRTENLDLNMPRLTNSERTGTLLHTPSLERIERALLILIGFLIAFSFHRLFITNINWD